MKLFLQSNLKYLRNLSGISQAQLGNDLDLHRSNIAAYESKGIEPGLKTLAKLAKYFNVDIQSLVSKNLTIPDNLKIARSYYSNQNQVLKYEIADLEIDTFINKTIQCRKILQGFIALHNFSIEKGTNSSVKAKSLRSNAGSLFSILEKLLSRNDKIIQILIKYR